MINGLIANHFDNLFIGLSFFFFLGRKKKMIPAS